MKCISLFCGVGGFDLALDRLGHECVYANDFDKYCKLVYDKNFKQKMHLEDITKVDVMAIPDHDLLVGGFPCPAFSIAGRRKGFEDLRGQLIYDILRILRAKKPKMFLLENVPGLLSHDDGKSMEIICEELCESGYAVDFDLLNSKNFSVAQSRLRVFIVGKRLDTLSQDEII